MSNKKATNKGGCKDVFHAFLVEKADYAGEEEISCIKTSSHLPERLIPFSKALSMISGLFFMNMIVR